MRHLANTALNLAWIRLRHGKSWKQNYSLEEYEEDAEPHTTMGYHYDKYGNIQSVICDRDFIGNYHGRRALGTLKYYYDDGEDHVG